MTNHITKLENVPWTLHATEIFHAGFIHEIYGGYNLTGGWTQNILFLM